MTLRTGGRPKPVGGRDASARGGRNFWNAAFEVETVLQGLVRLEGQWPWWRGRLWLPAQEGRPLTRSPGRRGGRCFCHKVGWASEVRGERPVACGEIVLVRGLWLVGR